jgi:cytochrome P450
VTMPARPWRPAAPGSLRELRDVDPYPAYERMRAVGNILWDEGMTAWLVLDHEGCAWVERNEDLFAEPTGTLPGAAGIVGRRDLRSLVGPQHEILHRALSHSWRPAAVAPYGPGLVRPLLADRLAALAPQPTLELFGDVAWMVPISVIAGVLGLEDRDVATLGQAKTWLEAVLAWRHTYGEDAELLAAALAATRALEPTLRDVVRARRDDPRDDTISALWTIGRQVAPDWDEQDVVDNAKFVFEGGSETTGLFLCNAVHQLLELDPAPRAAVIADRARLAAFLEEVLRHTTVVHVRARRATRDVTLGTVEIRAGERVLAINAAANRDPDRWPDPARFDAARPRLASHLAFNVGPRHCAGAHLARLEVSEAIRALFAVFPDLDGDPVAPRAEYLGFVSRAWRPLHLRHAVRTAAEAHTAIRALGA